jgi:hypothetical protein
VVERTPPFSCSSPLKLYKNECQKTRNILEEHVNHGPEIKDWAKITLRRILCTKERKIRL